MVEALPPVSAEAMAVPFLAARRWLAGQAEPDSFDVEGAETPQEERGERTSDTPARPAVVWQGDHSQVVAPDRLRPGQTIVVPSAYGAIAFSNWAPSAQEPVRDVAELAAVRQRRHAVARLHPAVLPPSFGPPPPAPSPHSSDSGSMSDRDIVIEWLRALDVSADEDG